MVNMTKRVPVTLTKIVPVSLRKREIPASTWRDR